MPSECKPNAWPRWGAVVVTALVAVVAYAVQWGVVTTKLDQIGRQIDGIATEMRTIRTGLAATESRVSRMEGRLIGSADALP